ncbi:U3 small nucleolar RNA-associated protein 18 homolog isoform X2 [Biomphalaria glabrata]|uniref:U3 small nucleolar RNA-associated protein 18 homolog isoform X2 n=1 Tax=Biomphalaria glabrata TaxID=6526 RepID=A0A9W3B7L4_BIOGL|nr:U3 small nucleolar RNA-associated protein 18 homolog isoform X2 [Biomphalaria glabrata]
MLRRKQLHQSSSTKFKEPETYIQPLGEQVKDEREITLEEEVLATGENVIEALPSIKPGEPKRKKRKRHGQGEIVKKWVDSDDEKAPEFEVITPDWAGTFDEEKSEDSDEEILKAHSHNSIVPSLTLPSTTLEFKRVTDANKEEPSKASIKCLEFHPKATALLIGGTDQTVRLFAIDGSKNRKIHSIFLERFPVFNAHFSRSGSEIIMGSKYKRFYIYDMEGNSGITFRPEVKGLEVSAMSKFVVSPDGRFIAFLGNFGFIHLFSQTSKELIDSLKMNESVKSVSFSQDGKFMYSFGAHLSDFIDFGQGCLCYTDHLSYHKGYLPCPVQLSNYKYNKLFFYTVHTSIRKDITICGVLLPSYVHNDTQTSLMKAFKKS